LLFHFHDFLFLQPSLLLGEVGDGLAAPVLREGILTPQRDPVTADEQTEDGGDERPARPIRRVGTFHNVILQSTHGSS
jgi:hypothetical protein